MMRCKWISWRLSAAALIAGMFVFHPEAQAMTIDFEDLSLDAQCHWSGPDPDGQFVQQTFPYEDDLQIGKFTSKNVDFSNSYSLTYSSWAGWAYSNMTYNPAAYMPGDGYPGDGSNGNPDPVPTGLGGQYYAAPGRDAGGAAVPGNYAMGYVGATFTPTVDFPAPTTLNGMYIANNNYAYYMMKEGDPNHIARQFTDGDYLKLTVVGKNLRGDVLGSVDSYLADFRDPASRTDDPRKDNYISNQWTWINLSGLGGGVSSLEFQLFSTDTGDKGINTPAYFAMDNLTTVGNPANDLAWSGSDAGHFTSNPANWNGHAPTPGKGWLISGTSCQLIHNDLPANTVVGSITAAPGYGCFLMDGTNAINLAGDISNLSYPPISISVPLVLDGGDRIFHSAPGDLTINGAISEAGGTFGIIKTGRGKAMLGGQNTYHGATRIESGTLALERYGDLSIASAISVAAGATLEIELGDHVLGTIDGLGTTLIDEDASLTATSIVQNTLIIGLPASAAVPEPGTFLMLMAAFSGMYFCRKKVFPRIKSGGLQSRS
jgi:autotransporter-associated beta strand protein